MQTAELVPIRGGRSCPLHYRYAPVSLAGTTPLRCETLYVVGGLYGNEPALGAVLEVFAREASAKRLVFDGDFNRFNVEVESFGSLEFDSDRWTGQFLQQWREGSDAHASYWQRITQGSGYEPAEALITSED